MSNVQEALKAAKERAAAQADPAFRPDTKQVQSSAATQEGQQTLDAQDAVAFGAQSKSHITDSAQDLRLSNMPELPPPAPLVQNPELVVTPEAVAAAEHRTFRHVYAGATTIMPDGKTLRFGGGVGGPGYYSTVDTKEIAFLEGLSKIHGSQISEPEMASQHEADFRHDLADAARAAGANTARYQDPRARQAFDNFDKLIRQG